MTYEFKAGDKVRCAGNSEYSCITKGSVYVVGAYDAKWNCVQVYDDDNDLLWFGASFFELVSDQNNRHKDVQPEALRLVEDLDLHGRPGGMSGEAANELRHLCGLSDELLEALEPYRKAWVGNSTCPEMQAKAASSARAAIEKATK